jgi:hypothetical protein
MGTRFVVAIDVDEDDLTKAYIELNKIMHQEVRACDVAWESTDEAFGPDGEHVNPDDLQSARMEGIDLIRNDYYGFPQKTTSYGNVCLECGAVINYGPRSEHDEECKYYRGE